MEIGVISCLVVILSTCSDASPLQNESSDSPWEEKNYRPTHFIQTVYKATMLSNDKIEIMDGPIILQNVRDEMYYVITSDNYEDYEIIPEDTNSTDQTMFQLQPTSTEPMKREFDVIILEALDDDLVPLARTTILVFNSNRELDMYKMKFKIDDNEYIVLNYFYFKWFLALLTVTGLLILAIEIHEIVRNVRAVRQKGNYKILHI